MPEIATPAAAIDHLVLPVTELAVARQRLTQLGFTVASDARHPFGTENACVFFADDTYLEPLAIGDRAAYAAAIEAGNVFVARDRQYRMAKEAGLSAIVAKSGDAAADDARFRAAGVSAGPMLDFERPLALPDGSRTVAGFRLAFAATRKSEPLFAFACERINALPADRGALQRHANAVHGMAGLVLVAAQPQAPATLLAALLGVREAPATDADTTVRGTTDRDATGSVLTFRTGNLRLEVVTPDAFEPLYGAPLPEDQGGVEAGLVLFATADMQVTEKLLAAKGLPFSRSHGRLVVPPAAGQGVAFAFEEIS
ncbi:VOC family protein [Rhizobium halophytocola]|uniref:Glyoxalase-like domain-containing protein n=1 Tax=Rhizobium halophytocola TaxID=735519 RepID=A0ABS4DWF1_9HYPH|nr:VOC family protein [Rhizobium halophytocola]MBP1850019.1 hypothetical protein [Rhizobium halophytocola]